MKEVCSLPIVSKKSPANITMFKSNKNSRFRSSQKEEEDSREATHHKEVVSGSLSIKTTLAETAEEDGRTKIKTALPRERNADYANESATSRSIVKVQNRR